MIFIFSVVSFLFDFENVMFSCFVISCLSQSLSNDHCLTYLSAPFQAMLSKSAADVAAIDLAERVELSVNHCQSAPFNFILLFCFLPPFCLYYHHHFVLTVKCWEREVLCFVQLEVQKSSLTVDLCNGSLLADFSILLLFKFLLAISFWNCF